MCLYCKLFPDEVKPHKDYIDAFVYSTRLKNNRTLQKPVNIGNAEWKKVVLKGVGDNNGFYEVEVKTK